MVERLHLLRVAAGDEQVRVAAGLLDGLPRLGELDLLDALLGDQERDLLAFECHVGLLSMSIMPDVCAHIVIISRRMITIWAHAAAIGSGSAAGAVAGHFFEDAARAALAVAGVQARHGRRAPRPGRGAVAGDPHLLATG